MTAPRESNDQNSTESNHMTNIIRQLQVSSCPSNPPPHPQTHPSGTLLDMFDCWFMVPWVTCTASLDDTSLPCFCSRHVAALRCYHGTVATLPCHFVTASIAVTRTARLWLHESHDIKWHVTMYLLVLLMQLELLLNLARCYLLCGVCICGWFTILSLHVALITRKHCRWDMCMS